MKMTCRVTVGLWHVARQSVLHMANSPRVKVGVAWLGQIVSAPPSDGVGGITAPACTQIQQGLLGLMRRREMMLQTAKEKEEGNLAR